MLLKMGKKPAWTEINAMSFTKRTVEELKSGTEACG